VLFVDGWTGKGAIANELNAAWQAITGCDSAELVVLADPGGWASLCGSHEDWLIPSGILGANISGLISRSILNDDVIGPDDFHGSIPVDHLADIDASRDFVDTITALVPQYRGIGAPHVTAHAKQQIRDEALATVNRIAEQFSVHNLNRIKPGIAEATRAILRRKPEKTFVRAASDPDLQALVHLCKTDDIELVEDPLLTGPYRAITLIMKSN